MYVCMYVCIRGLAMFAGARLNELASGDQRRRTGSGSALETCTRRCAIQICVFFTLLYSSAVVPDVIHVAECRLMTESAPRSQRHSWEYRKWQLSSTGTGNSIL